MDKLEKLLMKKKAGKEMSPIEREAKMGVVGDMRKMASEAMGDKLKGLQKVTVAAPDKDGLEMGLDKAQELLSAHQQPEDTEEGSEESEDHMDMHPEEELSEDELDEKLQHLMELKRQMSEKKGRI